MALDGTGFSLELRPLDSLHPHERTISTHVTKIESELQADGVQKDPIVADAASGTVLDGMHRLAALLKLGHANAVCCSVNYSSEMVKLRRWARWYVGPSAEDLAKVSETVGLSRQVGDDEGFELLSSRKAGLALFANGRSVTFERSSDLKRAFEAVDTLDRLAVERKWERRFIPEEEVRAALATGGLVALAEELSKDDVVSAATSGSLFPCKTSMHVIDPRPVGIRFPLAELDSDDGARRLDSILRKERVALPPGSAYGGRKYRERLIVLNPP